MMKISSIFLVFVLLFSLIVMASTNELKQYENEKETEDLKEKEKGCSSMNAPPRIAKTPVTWENIIANIDFETYFLEPKAFGRSQESHDAYESYKVATVGKYKDATEAILSEYFEKTTGLEKGETRFKRNQFPVYVAEGIEHWVLWIYDDEFKVDPKWVREEIENHIGDSSKIFRWAITPEAYRSVPGLCHVHVFVKNNE